jgi:hypothetical protein
MSNASDYADQLARQINDDTANDTLFGMSGGYGDTPEGDPVLAYEYIDDVLDIQYIVNGDREYVGARILITLGGPNAWINTLTGQLEVSWWSDTEYRTLPSEFIAALDDALKEFWDAGN